MSSSAYPSKARSSTFQKIVVRTTAGMEFPYHQLSLNESKIHPEALALAHGEFHPNEVARASALTLSSPEECGSQAVFM
jgi:hypothetical protein